MFHARKIHVLIFVLRCQLNVLSANGYFCNQYTKKYCRCTLRRKAAVGDQRKSFLGESRGAHPKHERESGGPDEKCWFTDVVNRILDRRQVFSRIQCLSLLSPALSQAKSCRDCDKLSVLRDPQSYSALLHVPPNADPNAKYPLLIVLHGAAKNSENDVWCLADIHGEHSGLPPSLISAGIAPSELTDQFVMVAPYAPGGTFYDEPRSKVLDFVDWICSDAPVPVGIDPSRKFLLGFSDGATCGIELMTSRRFAGAVIAAYGFTGTLPPLAVQRLLGIPIWVYHSADDVIFPVQCSDRLVQILRAANDNTDIIKYSRFDHDQEGFIGRVKGHSTGISASKNPETYQWLLSL